MKPFFDIAQIALSLPGALGYFAAVVLLYICLSVWRAVLVGIGAVWIGAKAVFRRVFAMSKAGVLLLCIAAIPLFFASGWISAQMQYIEQVLEPAYITADTSTHALAVYEAELYRHCDAYEADKVKRRVRDIAAKVESTPLAVLEVAYSECGLNPFCIRKDGIAAGFIQFTTAGLTGLGATLDQVKAACRSRDVDRIMDLTESYLVSRAAGRSLPDATAVYTAVFAPGFIGQPDGAVLYSRRDGDAYTLNSIFDGYYVEKSGRIMRSESAKDGRITIGEMRLHLEAKKFKLLKL